MVNLSFLLDTGQGHRCIGAETVKLKLMTRLVVAVCALDTADKPTETCIGIWLLAHSKAA